MPPIDLEEYRRNQQPGNRRAGSPTAGLPADPADPPLDENGTAILTPAAQQPPRPGSRLTIPAEEALLEDSAPRSPAATDLYMQQLLERQRPAGAEDDVEQEHRSVDDAVAETPNGDPCPADPPESALTDEQDRFFDDLARQLPRPIIRAPTAAGSAGLRPAAAKPRRPGYAHARANGTTVTERRPIPKKVPRRLLAIAALAVLLVAGVFVANRAGTPPLRSSLGNASTNTGAVGKGSLDVLVSKAFSALPISQLIISQQSAHPKPRRRRAVYPRRRPAPRGRVLAASAPAVRTSSPSVSTRGSSGYTSSSAAATNGGSSSASSAGVSPPPAASHPAYGPAGTLGPGRGSPSTQ